MEDLADLGLMLSRLLLMEQAAFFYRQFLDFLPPSDDGCGAPIIGIGRRDVADALVVAAVVVIVDEGLVLIFKIAGQVVIFQQDPVLQRLMPALDLALGLRVIRCTADVI